MVHYKKKDNKWVGQFIDSCYIVNFPKLLFKTNKLYYVYSKTWVAEKQFICDLFFTKYDIITDIKKEPNQLQEFKIYPNPGRENICIEFKNNKQQYINLSVFDMNGKYIITLISEIKPQGVYRQLWNGTDKHRKEVSPGSYLVRLKLGLPAGEAGRNTVKGLVEIIK